MEWNDPSLLNSSIPFTFTDGTDIFNELAKKYIKHSKGLFILGPSGVGKTHFIKQQSEANWIDGDILWYAANALPGGKWWEADLEEINRIEARCDVVTLEAKRQGFWIMGTSNYWLKPDAIVVPDLDTHKKYIETREDKGYDGGLTTNDFEQMKAHREVILEWKQKGVPCFTSVQEAAKYLASL